MSQSEDAMEKGREEELDDGSLIDLTRVREVDGNYEFRGVIGRGGYADIWVAKDLRNKRTVAIKSLHDDRVSEKNVREAFLQEARLMVQLRHSGIVPVYDFFTDHRGRYHLVMKLILGRTLNDLLVQTHEEYKGLKRREMAHREDKQLRERLEIFLRVCDIVSYAHSKGVLHRDLKPANIMLGVNDEIYVMDWGIAEKHERGVALQTPKETMGTLRYLAPEIIRRKTYDERSDVYALGTVLFELTYLHAAFPMEDDKEACQCIIQGRTSPRKHDYGFDVPQWLAQVIYKAIYPDPLGRTLSVSMMANRIREGMQNDGGLLKCLKLLIGL